LTIQAKDINLCYLINNFGIELVFDANFFRKWEEDLPELTDLDKVKTGYFNLLNYPPLLEDVVKMAIVDPIIFIGDFYIAIRNHL
jgi:hypothetical protein